MKTISRIVICLPLLMLNLEHKPNDNFYIQPNESLNLRDFKLVLNIASATMNNQTGEEEEEEEDVEHIEVIGTRPDDWDLGWDHDMDWEREDECTNISLCGDDEREVTGGSSRPVPKDKKCANGYTKSELDKLLSDSLSYLAEMERDWNTALTIEGSMYGAFAQWKLRHLSWRDYNFGKYISGIVATAYTIPMISLNGYLSDGARKRILEQYHNDVKGCS